MALYKKRVKLEEWGNTADFVKKHMMRTSNDERDPGNNEYLYNRVRAYIQKDMERIDGLKWRFTLPLPEKLAEYADI